MSVFTPVSDAEARALLEHYSLGALEKLEGIAQGVENTNYFLTATTGQYVLTLFEHIARGDLPFYVGLNIQLPNEQSENAYQDVSHTFQHFFARKVMFVKLSCAFVMMPGGFGTLDELMEVLTLVQTGKIRRVPVILVNSAFWKGLLDWVRGQLAADGMIGAEDPGLMQVIDDPQAVVDAIFDHYHSRGFEPSPSEREAELAL